MKSKDQQLLEEAYGKVAKGSSMTPVDSKYIYFTDEKEFFRVHPYKLILPEDPEMNNISKDKNDWNDVHVAVGEDIKELGYGDESIVNDQWYIVDNSFPMDHKHRAFISKNK